MSLPFSDHCEPLLSDTNELPDFVAWLCRDSDLRALKYFELRLLPRHEIPDRLLVPSHSYCFHTLDLKRPLEVIFGRMHKDSIQRRIRRASREQLYCEVGRSRDLVHDFYRLLIMTRDRHHVPPQPLAWFRNLIECMGEKVQISVARKSNVSIAAMLTLRHGAKVVYKYGCSDAQYHHLGGMPFLFWKLIEASKRSGATEIDFGRAELDHQGLITFKDRFGTSRKQLTYFRYPQAEKRAGMWSWSAQTLGRVLAVLPTYVMPSIGRVMYRHIG